MTEPVDRGHAVDSIEFFFDPICPWAWRTARFVRAVAERRPLSISWRFIALRRVNEGRDYASDLPPGYLERHDYGRGLLRIAARCRREGGNTAVEQFYLACGRVLHDEGRRDELAGSAAFGPVLLAAGLPSGFEAAAGEGQWDEMIDAETQLALRRAGPGVGTPIISFGPPDGPSFFGPVIGDLPGSTDLDALWDSLVVLVHTPGFCELKTSIRPSIDQSVSAQP